MSGSLAMRPEMIVEQAIRAAVGSPEYVARIIVEDLRAAGLLMQHEKLREALRFYADPQTWNHITPRGTVTTNTLAKQDNGDRARAALESR